MLFIKHPHRNNYTELSVHERDDHGTDLDHGTRCALLGFGVTDRPRWTAEYHDQDQSILKLHHYRMILKTDGVMNLVPFEKHGRNSWTESGPSNQSGVDLAHVYIHTTGQLNNGLTHSLVTHRIFMRFFTYHYLIIVLNTLSPIGTGFEGTSRKEKNGCKTLPMTFTSYIFASKLWTIPSWNCNYRILNSPWSSINGVYCYIINQCINISLLENFSIKHHRDSLIPIAFELKLSHGTSHSIYLHYTYGVNNRDSFHYLQTHYLTTAYFVCATDYTGFAISVWFT